LDKFLPLSLDNANRALIILAILDADLPPGCLFIYTLASASGRLYTVLPFRVTKNRISYTRSVVPVFSSSVVMLSSNPALFRPLIRALKSFIGYTSIALRFRVNVRLAFFIRRIFSLLSVIVANTLLTALT